ncbi:hypothetical protein AB0H00_22545 [Nocardia sp. NPDC023852]|uniref:hypothetical protein n=1 Tax=Nocardia sp. NPDC023852 TaxID=3154697 RepID=UPI0033E7E9EF
MRTLRARTTGVRLADAVRVYLATITAVNTRRAVTPPRWIGWSAISTLIVT